MLQGPKLLKVVALNECIFRLIFDRHMHPGTSYLMHVSIITRTEKARMRYPIIQNITITNNFVYISTYQNSEPRGFVDIQIDLQIPNAQHCIVITDKYSFLDINNNPMDDSEESDTCLYKDSTLKVVTDYGRNS